MEKLDYISARNFTRSLNFNTRKQWFQYRNEPLAPSFLPKNPENYYLRSGWVSWEEFLFKKEKEYILFEDFYEYLNVS